MRESFLYLPSQSFLKERINVVHNEISLFGNGGVCVCVCQTMNKQPRFNTDHVLSSTFLLVT